MSRIVSQAGRSGHMQPVQTALHPHAALIEMSNIGVNDLLFDAGKRFLASFDKDGEILFQDTLYSSYIPYQVAPGSPELQSGG